MLKGSSDYKLFGSSVWCLLPSIQEFIISEERKKSLNRKIATNPKELLYQWVYDSIQITLISCKLLSSQSFPFIDSYKQNSFNKNLYVRINKTEHWEIKEQKIVKKQNRCIIDVNIRQKLHTCSYKSSNIFLGSLSCETWGKTASHLPPLIQQQKFQDCLLY